MKHVILSHDSKALLYLVPDEVAERLEDYCMEFACRWLWEDTNVQKLLQEVGGVTCAVYGAPDFIDYLNRWVFPQEPSSLVRELDFYGYEEVFPEEYRQYPRFNF